MAATCAAASAAFPTLLTSRPRASECGRKGIEVKLPEEYSLPVRVRNTFIDTSGERSPSLERFYREREVTTCPSAHIGRFRSLFRDADGDEEHAQWPAQASEALGLSEIATPDGSPMAARYYSRSPAPWPTQSLEVPGASEIATPDGSPMGAHYSRSPPALVLSLAEALSLAAPSPPPRAAAAGSGQPALGGAGGGGPSSLADAEVQRPSCPPPERSAPGSAELPSIGSAGHATRRCKPCAFFHTEGCSNGFACQFCHLCEAGEKKRRQREKVEARRSARQAPPGGAPSEDRKLGRARKGGGGEADARRR